MNYEIRVSINRKALNDQKETKLLLDCYKGASKDQRDKVQVMATEKKLRSEIEELRSQMKKIQVKKHNKNIEIDIRGFEFIGKFSK